VRRPAALAILREWRAVLTDADNMYAPSNRGAVFAITDQLAFNMILERGISPIRSVDPAGDWRVIRAMNDTIALLPLPALLFTTGHTFFYQHLPEVHHTKVRGWPASLVRAGRIRPRMRESQRLRREIDS
jgi:hypothetical protein